MSETDQAALQSIAKGSQSFHLACRFFDRGQELSAAQIYRWCRYCDDQVDEGRATDTTIRELRELTGRAFAGEKDLPPVFNSFHQAVDRAQIPEVYAQELLSGMEMDLNHTRYNTLEDLKVYCYRVASTVGLMMCHVMGIFDQKALAHAARLGMAMQLTNICRDVKTDYEMGRVYLPLSWLRLVALDEKTYFQPEYRDCLFMVVKKLLAEAEELYEEGLAGVRFLPWRPALAVMIAAKIYREIGREILRRGPSALDQRTVVSKRRKLVLVLSALYELSLSFLSRLRPGIRTVPITQTWIYP